MERPVFFIQQKVCPVCETKFNITRVRSSACFVVHRETDYHVKYRDTDPLLYSIWVCPQCQYANTDKDFGEEIGFHELQKLKKALPLLKTSEPDLSCERTPQTALRATILAIRTSQVRHSPAIIKAGFYMRSAWFCRDLGKTEDELGFLEEAKNLYQYSFEKEWGRHAAKISDSRIMYMIGELNRRLGNYKEAINWFSRTVMNKEIKKEPELNRLVREQWESARAEYKKQQSESLTSENMETDVLTNKTVENNTVLKPKTRTSKVKMMVSLYMDQIEWLNSISNTAYEKHQVYVDKEAVARAVIDAVMERFPELDEFKSEEELKCLLLEKLSSI
jgi:uncharacterized protein (DUF2225 family)